MIPAQLSNEVEQLRTEGQNIELTESEGFIDLVTYEFPLPSGYSKKNIERLLIRIPISYPNGKPDMFWTEEDVLLADGTPVKQSENFQDFFGKKWRRFSWHPKSWNPGFDNLFTFLAFIKSGLEQGKSAK